MSQIQAQYRLPNINIIIAGRNFTHFSSELSTEKEKLTTGHNFVNLGVCLGFLPPALPPGLKTSPGLAGKKSRGGGGRLKRKLVAEVVLFHGKCHFYEKQDAFSPEKAFLKMFALEILGKTNLNFSQKRRFLFYFRRILSCVIIHTVGITSTLFHSTALGLVYNMT